LRNASHAYIALLVGDARLILGFTNTFPSVPIALLTQALIVFQAIPSNVELPFIHFFSLHTHCIQILVVEGRLGGIFNLRAVDLVVSGDPGI